MNISDFKISKIQQGTKMKKDFKSPMKKISHQQIDEQLKNQDITNPEPFHIHPSYNVVGAAIMKDNKVLIAQRRDGELKGKWEFPGGKIEEGETPQQALQREIKEELDIDVSVLNRIDSSYWEYTDRNINLSVYECAYVS